jgi:hypothetical protein
MACLKHFMRKRISFLTFFVLAASFFSSFALANRPLTTDDASTVAKGKIQLETGLDLVRQDSHDTIFSPSVALTYGLLENLDLAIGGQYLFRYADKDKDVSGLGDLEFKAKYRFIDEKGWLPSLAIAGMLKIPTASESKGLGSGKADYNINAIFTRSLSEHRFLDVNLGYTLVGERGADNAFNASVAGRFAVSPRWTVVGEAAVVNNFNGRSGDDLHSALLGTQYRITENAVWDTGVEVGRNNGAQYFRLTTGLTLLFQP